jgi:hypothetical protein
MRTGRILISNSSDRFAGRCVVEEWIGSPHNQQRIKSNIFASDPLNVSRERGERERQKSAKPLQTWREPMTRWQAR